MIFNCRLGTLWNYQYNVYDHLEDHDKRFLKVLVPVSFLIVFVGKFIVCKQVHLLICLFSFPSKINSFTKVVFLRSCDSNHNQCHVIS